MQEFSHTLLVARRKAGLSQSDCAHLLGRSASRVSRLESGKATPTSDDLIGVALLFGRTIEALSGPKFAARAQEMKERLFDLPCPDRNWLGRFNRSNTLDGLAHRLDRITDVYGR